MAARNNAFTLLELMLATVLSVMLMVGVMGVVGQIRHSAAIGPSTSQSSALDEALDAWVRLLREDLNQTTQPVTSKSNELALIALGGLDAGRLERTHRPACIVYRLASIGGRSWLVRSQTLLDVPADHAVQHDLICCGVIRFELIRSVADVPTQPEAAEPGIVWRLRAWTATQETPSFDRILAVERAGGA